MKLPLFARIRPGIFVVPTIVVVLALAVLLYRWSNQVSETTTVRLADSLQMSMVNWHLNLFRDLSDICLALQVEREEGENPDGLNDYPRRISTWKNTAPYPDLIAELYVLRKATSQGPGAYRLDPESNGFKNGDWPGEFAHLRPRLEQLGSAEDPQKAQHDNYYPGGGDTAGWRFEPGIPALIRPIRQGWLAVKLNREVIQTRVFPDLAHRYFTGLDGLDYMIAVVSGSSPRTVIYSSDPDFGSQEVSDADGRMDIFARSSMSDAGSSIYIFHKHSENTAPERPPGMIGTVWFPLVTKDAGIPHWELIVRHRRGGALGAFVAEMHERDLAISFGVLGLLTLSIAMLVVTSQRAHRLAKLQMDFVTAISHELRTPLTVIKSAAENIAHGVVDSKQQIVNYGLVIEGRARQLSRLVEQILMFAATRENHQRYDLRSLAIDEILDATLSGTEDLISASGFSLERSIPENLPRVTGDLFALSHCLQNLITNAIKYGGSDRWIGIRAETVSNHVLIHVSDHGMGIEARDLPRVFEPFYRAAAAVSAQIHGTGLGLALARNIAEAMHGQLSVQSVPGRSSTFTLSLPVTSSSQRMETPVSQQTS